MTAQDAMVRGVGGTTCTHAHTHTSSQFPPSPRQWQCYRQAGAWDAVLQGGGDTCTDQHTPVPPATAQEELGQAVCVALPPYWTATCAHGCLSLPATAPLTWGLGRHQNKSSPRAPFSQNASSAAGFWPWPTNSDLAHLASALLVSLVSWPFGPVLHLVPAALVSLI